MSQHGADILPTWMRRVFFLTAVMNILVAGAFRPSAGALREMARMPAGAPRVYLLTDLVFGALFLIWLFSDQPAVSAEQTALRAPR